MTPEKRVKVKICKTLDKMGAYRFYASTGGYGSSGVPDIIACYRGRFIGIEAKANGGKPTALQLKNLNDIENCGGQALVIDERNINELELLISKFQVEDTKNE
jgi:Holliday junction resolvase